jgi:hypothetical protein
MTHNRSGRIPSRIEALDGLSILTENLRFFIGEEAVFCAPEAEIPSPRSLE